MSLLFTIGGSREKPALLFSNPHNDDAFRLRPGDYAVYYNRVDPIYCLKLYTQRLINKNYESVDYDYNYWKNKQTGKGVILVNIANQTEPSSSL